MTRGFVPPNNFIAGEGATPHHQLADWWRLFSLRIAVGVLTIKECDFNLCERGLGRGQYPSPKNICGFEYQNVDFYCILGAIFFAVQLPVVHAKTLLLGLENLLLHAKLVICYANLASFLLEAKSCRWLWLYLPIFCFSKPSSMILHGGQGGHSPPRSP